MTIKVLEMATPVARKVHRCDSCSNEIRKGCRYLRAGIVHENQAYTWESHTVDSIRYALESCSSTSTVSGGDAYCDSLINVYRYDMDAEMRELVRDADPVLHAEIAEYCKNWRD